MSRPSALQPTETESIRKWNDGLTKTVSLRFIKTDDSRNEDFQTFIDAFTALAPRVRVDTERNEEEGPPEFRVGEALRYHAIPTGSELTPFLNILSMQDLTSPDLDERTRERLATVDLPAQMKLYMTLHCHFCPQVVGRVTSFTHVNPLLHVTVIDGMLFPEMAERDAVRSVPTLILDDRFRWTGTFQTEEILEVLARRDPSQLSAESLKSILKEGDAQRLAQMMLEQCLIFPAFLDLLKHPDWSVRLGAMVVMEEMADRNPDLAGEVLEPLWEALSDLEDPVKGDIFYLFGLLGSTEWIPKLQGLLQEQERIDLREVLEEAIETLKQGRETDSDVHQN